MFPTIGYCVLVFCLMSEAVGFLTFQASGNIGQGRRQTQDSTEPFMFRNAFNTGQMLAQAGKQSHRDLSGLAGVPIGGSVKTPFFGFNAGSGYGQPQEPVDSAMVNNAVASSKMLVQLGKQELRELSDLAGVKIGGDLLFGNGESGRPLSFGFNLGSNPNPNTPTTATSDGTYNTVPAQLPQPLPITAPPAALAVSQPTGTNNEMVYQPFSFQVPQSLQLAETPQITIPSSNPPPPYKGTYNPLAEDDFHVSFSMLNPSKSSSKTQDPPVMYPIQFYNPQVLQEASLQLKPESKSEYQSNYDNFDAW